MIRGLLAPLGSVGGQYILAVQQLRAAILVSIAGKNCDLSGCEGAKQHDIRLIIPLTLI